MVTFGFTSTPEYLHSNMKVKCQAWTIFTKNIDEFRSYTSAVFEKLVFTGFAQQVYQQQVLQKEFS